MTKTQNNVAIALLFVVVVVGSFLLLNWAGRSTMEAVQWQEENYRVRSGDTLWGIAGKYCPDSVDRRDWIEEVRALNEMPDVIVYHGQQLTVLAPVEEVEP